MWVCYALSVLKPLLRKPEMTIYNSGDTNSNEIEFVPAAIIVRSAGISKSVLNDPRGWATANGIRWRCFGGQVYFAVLDIDAWRPEVKPAQTMKPEPVKVVASVPEGCVTIPAAELAMLRSRLSSLDNSLLLINDQIRRTSEPDEADYFDLTELGKPYGWSAILMNRVLTQLELQVDQRKPNGNHDKYLLTDIGREHGCAFSGLRSKSGFQGRHVKWKPSIVPLIERWIDCGNS